MRLELLVAPLDPTGWRAANSFEAGARQAIADAAGLAADDLRLDQTWWERGAAGNPFTWLMVEVERMLPSQFQYLSPSDRNAITHAVNDKVGPSGTAYRIDRLHTGRGRRPWLDSE